MKRRIAWLALPLLLAALVFGVKWRVDHPTPTQEDLKIRALLGRAFMVEVKEDSLWYSRNRYGYLNR
jgi:hypothetical protein